ncbi:MAG: hypothetical protein OXC37_04275 [Bdellovibrionaceae bacterium]|nr:hypothetical protein [Pseudobdellovibrionaceae bacterium]
MLNSWLLVMAKSSQLFKRSLKKKKKGEKKMKTIITVMVLYWFIAGNIVYADKPVVQNEEVMQENTEQEGEKDQNSFP